MVNFFENQNPGGAVAPPCTCLRAPMRGGISGGDLSPSLGRGTESFSRAKISEWHSFRKKFPFSRLKFLMTFFSCRPGFRIFPFFYLIFRIFTILNVVYDPFLTRKTSFFTLFVLSRASNNTTSQNIWGDGCMGGPPLKIFWGIVLQSPIGLRPWEQWRN